MSERFLYPLNNDTAEAAYNIWNYLRVEDPLERADCIMVLGCSKNQVGFTAARLYHQGYSDLIVSTGGNSKKSDGWNVTEARVNEVTLLDLGVPASNIKKDGKATNFGDNIKFTRELLLEAGLKPNVVIGVPIDFGARRWKASMLKQWPAVYPIVVPSGLEFNSFLQSETTFSEFTISLTTEFDKVISYSQRGFTVEQDLKNPDYLAAREAANYLEEFSRLKQPVMV